MANRGGFSWRRLTGISAAKSRISRTIGVPLSRSGRNQKVGRIVTGGGCLLPLVLALVCALSVGCSGSNAREPSADGGTIADQVALASGVQQGDPLMPPTLDDPGQYGYEKMIGASESNPVWAITEQLPMERGEGEERRESYLFGDGSKLVVVGVPIGGEGSELGLELKRFEVIE